jgi:hypothetical protein
MTYLPIGKKDAETEPLLDHLYTKFQLSGDSFTDVSLSALPISNTSVTIDTNIKQYGNSSLYFNGASKLLIQNYAKKIVFSTYPWTIEMWLRWGQPGQYGPMIFTGTGQRMTPNVLGQGTVFNFAYTAANGNVTSFLQTTESQNVWYHYAIQREENRIYMYLNGNRDLSSNATKTVDQIWPILTEDDFSMGWAPSWGGLSWAHAEFTGWIQDFRITIGKNRYTGPTFTPPTQPLPIPVAPPSDQIGKVKTDLDGKFWIYGHLNNTQQGWRLL